MMFPTWNEKNLDYEIETSGFSGVNTLSVSLTWNEKNLDYEIETKFSVLDAAPRFYLKWKEPRLRDWNVPSFFRLSSKCASSWNEKNLDYEIET